MLLDGLIKHQCPFRAVAAAPSSTHIIAHLQFLPFLSERSSVGRLWEARQIGIATAQNPLRARACKCLNQWGHNLGGIAAHK